MKEVLSPEQAEQEISNWLDAKRISPRKRENDTYRTAVEALIDGLIYGDIAIQEDRSITHTLICPIDGMDKQISYKPRITVEQVESRMPGAKNNRVFATMAALTDQSIGLLKKMSTEDSSIANAITIFFL